MDRPRVFCGRSERSDLMPVGSVCVEALDRDGELEKLSGEMASNCTHVFAGELIISQHGSSVSPSRPSPSEVLTHQLGMRSQRSVF